MPTLLVESPPPRRNSGELPTILPLQNGDRLSSREFLRRYSAMPALKKAELIEGIVYMGSPVSVMHAEREALIHSWLGYYAARTPLVKHAANATTILDPENTHQPDAWLRLLPEYGGRAHINEDDLLVGAPELTVEVALSSASIDLGAKRRAAQRNGVLEYLVWIVAEGEFKWFVLTEEEYVEQQPDAKGLLKSHTFPGLVLPVDALLRMDGATVFAALEDAFKSPEHAAFFARAKDKAAG